MIGFNEEPVNDRGHANEDPDTKNLDKKELYTMIAHRYYLPPFASRGLNREYLIKVHKNQVYRVLMLELKHFEVELTNAMTKRIGLPNNVLLQRKLNALLRSRRQPELGFEEYDSPDEVISLHKTWLYRVARYIDKSNLLEFFENPVNQEDISTISSNPISRVYFGRMKASKYFFRFPEAKKDKKLWENLRAISSNYKAYLGHKLMVDKLKFDLDGAVKKAAEVERVLDDLISRCGFSYSAIEDPRIRPEHLINGGDSLTKAVRDKILLNCRM